TRSDRDWSSDVCSSDLLEPGWFRDRIAGRLAARAGDGEALAAIAATQGARSARGLVRMRLMIAPELTLLAVAGLVVVGLLRRRKIGRASGRERVEMWGV